MGAEGLCGNGRLTEDRLRIVAELFRCSEHALAVNHGGDHNLIILQTVNKAITVDHQFADVLVVELGNLAPGTRKLRQHPCLVHNLLYHDARVS